MAFPTQPCKSGGSGSSRAVSEDSFDRSASAATDPPVTHAAKNAPMKYPVGTLVKKVCFVVISVINLQLIGE